MALNKYQLLDEQERKEFLAELITSFHSDDKYFDLAADIINDSSKARPRGVLYPQYIKNMTLSYTVPGFKEKILEGIKIHTLRTDRVNRWKPGYMIHHATGNRTPEYNCFLKNKCKSVQQVLLLLLIDGDGEPYIKATVDRNRISREAMLEMVKNDGFDTEEDMLAWFFKDGLTMWAGKIIHWTDKKY